VEYLPSQITNSQSSSYHLTASSTTTILIHSLHLTTNTIPAIQSITTIPSPNHHLVHKPNQLAPSPFTTLPSPYHLHQSEFASIPHPNHPPIFLKLKPPCLESPKSSHS
jgi:hypothetical protein